MYKITTEPIKTITGKRTGKFKAYFGPYVELGATKEEAIKNMKEGLDWYFSGIEESISKIQTKKMFFVMERNFGGYAITGFVLGSKYSCVIVSVGRMGSYQADKQFELYVNNYIAGTDDSLITA
jgi:hypothetical protein